MANRLAGETSPYLLQHAGNPVDWHPWGEEALERARREDRPIFLSIGYAACHWCHVMERESFEDPATAAELNATFVPVKVDREERPDLDAIYMEAVVAMTGSGGWPMSVFLAPDGRPFYGGTYFPPVPRHGMPAFRQVLHAVAGAWRERRDELDAAAARLVAALAPAPGGRSDAVGLDPTTATLDAAVAGLESSFDRATGGWGGAPKFPHAMALQFLLVRALDGDDRAAAVARRGLDALADGGIRDQLGGGFHRYATDPVWLVPHFERMLYDNALLARTYLHAFRLWGEPRDLEVATGIVDWLERELVTVDGGWAASTDADTDGEEGLTFTWTAAEVAAVAGDDARLVAAAYGVTDGGNWEGRTILSRVASDEALAARFGSPVETIAGRLAAARGRLLARRETRPQPARDDKVLAAWNGLALAAVAEAAETLASSDDPARRTTGERYAAAAVRVGTLAATRFRDASGRLGRSWKDGRLTGRGVLEDHADLAEGFLALHRATGDERWWAEARRLADEIVTGFADPAGGFWDVATDHETLYRRPRDPQDNATPSGGAMATTVLLRVAALTGEARYREVAAAALRSVAGYLPRHPLGFGQWLLAADLAVAGIDEVAIAGDPADPAVHRLAAPLRDGFRPRSVLAIGDPARSTVPLLAGRFALAGRPTAFVCRDFACRQPVDEPEALRALLAR
ncbi:MAG: hypothetical protein RL338_1497 [Chloroflexota bacterium]